MPDRALSRASRNSDGELPQARARRSLLSLDPELGGLLAPERLATARAEITVAVHRIATGAWPLKAAPDGPTHHLGLLVLDGVVACDVVLENVISTELVGAGDVLRPWSVDGPERMLAADEGWMVLADCRVAMLDQRAAAALARYPEIYAVLVERLDRRARRLARTQAIAQLTRVDRRILAVLRLLAERWGRMTADGVLIPLNISHRLLGQLIGARRPTVSTAVSELTHQGCLERRPDGGWMLHPDFLEAPAHTERLMSRRPLLIDGATSEHDAPEAADLAHRLNELQREAAVLAASLDALPDGSANGRRPGP